MSQPETYATLGELVEDHYEEILAGKLRPYKVAVGELERYILSNSPGQAALAMCCVESVTQKQIYTATLNVLLNRQRESETSAK